ncbi:MAG: hypothetical protein HGA78_12630 [Nitrospirales bacterium]|nr:hypothetical protein [Nitrospirales bacterium]
MDLHSAKIPSGPNFLKALEEKRELTFYSSLGEGRVGCFLLLPLYKGEDFLGLIYAITVKEEK